jgi:hypothetical protein
MVFSLYRYVPSIPLLTTKDHTGGGSMIEYFAIAIL